MSLLLVLLGPVLDVEGQATPQSSAFKRDHAWVDPLTIAPLLSGNFGELRGNHFHTGVDLKTEGREGLPVLAATDGKVARVKMSPWGYGNALYLEGPDSITTVYAHLQRFAPEVQDWAVARTYAGRTLGIDASPPTSAGLEFRAGDTLGWSGNSGGSGGPHLHFEVRSTVNQHPLNPLDGWLAKTDTRPPELPKLWIETQAGHFNWPLPTKDTLVLHEAVRFSVEGYDLLDGASNICGLRTLEARVLDSAGNLMLDHQASWSELDFAVNKDMNAHAFFPVWSAQRSQVHRLHRIPSNRLGIYLTPANEGWIDLAVGQQAVLRIRATDAAGNENEVEVHLKGGDRIRPLTGENLKSSDGLRFVVHPNEGGKAEQDGVEVTWNAHMVFEVETFELRVHSGGQQLELMPIDVPFRRGLQVEWPERLIAESWEGGWAVWPGSPLPKDRWMAVQRDEKGGVNRTEVATWTGASWRVELPRGGGWMLERDTIGPRVIPYYSQTPLVNSGDAVWYVEDGLAGIAELELTVDGNWTRCVWDPKRNMLTYEASDGVHPLGTSCPVTLKVTDNVGNVTIWERMLTWP